jgi:hypothetical protein
MAGSVVGRTRFIKRCEQRKVQLRSIKGCSSDVTATCSILLPRWFVRQTTKYTFGELGQQCCDPR